MPTLLPPAHFPDLTFRRRRLDRHGAGLLGAALLHLLGAWMWVKPGDTARTAPLQHRSAPVTVWLPELPQFLPAAPVPPIVLRDPRDTRDKARSFSTTTSPARASAIVTPDIAAYDAATVAPPAPGTPQSQAAAPAPTLNLALPRATLSTLAAPGLAAKTPFHGRLPATVERQIEDVAAQSGPWIEEPLDYDHVRFRRGTTCVTMERPAASRIDPSNDALQRLPWLANLHKCP